jgi:hypothetical protein
MPPVNHDSGAARAAFVRFAETSGGTAMVRIRTDTVMTMCLLVGGMLFGAAAWRVASAQTTKERFTGFAINMNGGRSTATVDFVIDGWSTIAQRDSLLSILKEQKDVFRANEQLVRALQKQPKVGYIRTTNTLAWDLHYARQMPLPDGGRAIVLATDRPIAFAEARNQTRTMDYPFTIVQIQLDKADKGAGKILAGTKLFIDKKTNELVLENYAQQPIRFNEIRKVK